MPIDKIGSVDRYFVLNKPNFVKSNLKSSETIQDTIHLTEDAKSNVEILKIRDLAMSAPDLRVEKIAELDKKIQNPSYPDQAVIMDLAERLLDYWKT